MDTLAKTVPLDVVAKVDTFLGIKGRPHLILMDGQWLDTGCVEWSTIPSLGLTHCNQSATLLDAFRRFYAEWAGKNMGGQETVDAFFANEPDAVQQEYQGYMDVQRKNAERYREPAALSLQQVRRLVQDDAVFVYSWNTSFDFPDFAKNGMTPELVIMPSENQFDALVVEQTDGVNRGIMTEDLVARLMDIDERFGVDLTSAGPGLAFELKRIPTGQEATDFAYHLSTFCPDSYWTQEDAMRAIERGKIDLWWD